MGRLLITLAKALLFVQPIVSFNHPHVSNRSTTRTALWEQKPKRLGRQDGVYARPSGAIERGSGFFFPGLEGPKVRLASGTIMLLAVAINHVISAGNTTPLEGLAVFYSALVLVQGIVQLEREERAEGDSVSSGDVVSYQLVWSVPIEDIEWRERVEWVARTLTTRTACTHALLLSSEANIFSFGRTTIEKNKDLRMAALQTIRKSTSGRVALPEDHPVMPFLDPEYRKTVILQRCEPGMCWIFASNQKLGSYSDADLQWMGSMGDFTSISAAIEQP